MSHVHLPFWQPPEGVLLSKGQSFHLHSILEHLQFESLNLHWASHYQEAVGALSWGVSTRL